MRRVVARNTSILLIQYALSSLVPLLLVPHLLKHIGLTAFGEISIALAFATYAGLIVSYAFQITGPAHIAETVTEEQRCRVFGEITGTKLLLLISVLGACTLIAIALPPTKSLYVVVFVSITVGATFNSSWFLQAVDRYFSLTMVSVAAAFLSLLIGFGFVSENAAHLDLTAAIALTVSPLVGGLATFVLALRVTNQNRIYVNLARSFEILRRGWPLFLSQITSALYTASGPIVIGVLRDSTAAGTYGAVERMVSALTNVLMLVHVAAYPKLAALYGRDREKYWALLYFVVGLYLLCAFVALILGTWANDALLRAVFGHDIKEGRLLLFWSQIWMLLSIFGVVVTGFLTVSGNGSRVFPLTLKVLVAAVAVGIPGVLIFGAYAWMAALAVSQILVVFTGYRLWKKYGSKPSQRLGR